MKYFGKEYGTSEANRLWGKTLELYKSFVEKAPDIGGKENNMSNNLYMALAVFAFYEAADPGHRFSNEFPNENPSKSA